MTETTADQIRAVQALLQQSLNNADNTPKGQSFTVAVQSGPINVDQLTRSLFLDGTALPAGTDQVLLKTAQGDLLLKLQNVQDQLLQDLLPARVSLQIKPGSSGADAVLVFPKGVATDNTHGLGGIAASVSSNSGTANALQSVQAEFPKIGQVFQATLLPAALFSSLGLLKPTPEQQTGAQSKPGLGTGAQTNILQNTVKATSENAAKAGEQSSGNNPAAPSKANLLLPNTQASASANSQGGQSQQQEQNLRNLVGQNIGSTADSAPHNSGAPQNTAIRIVKVITPDQANTGKIGAAALAGEAEEENTLTATVRGQTPSGQPLLAVGEQILAVRGGPRNWPVGTEVQLAIGAGADLVALKESAGKGNWNGLQQTLALLAQSNPALFHELTALRIPQAQTQQLPGALLFFLSAAQGGNLSKWLGTELEEKLESVKRNDLLQKIQDEWHANQTRAFDEVNGEWRGMHVPYAGQDQLHSFRFYVHSRARDGEKQKEGDARDWAKRFLIDLSLSRLGPIQLDGLVHKKKLDLVVRTEHALPAEVKHSLQQHFIKNVEEVRYSGELRFQANKIGWVSLKENITHKLSRDI